MKPHILHGRITKTVETTKSHQTWHLAGDGRIVGPEIGMFADDQYDDVDIIVDGRITGVTDTGVVSQSESGHVVVGRSGHIEAEGINSFGIEFSSGNDASIVNNGLVEAVNGVYLLGRDVRLVNNASGTIRGTNYGVLLQGYEDTPAKLVNHGLIEGKPGDATAGVLAFGERDWIINDGRIVGNIILNVGDDIVDNRGGKIVGSILGGGGDDTLVTDDASVVLTAAAGEGADTVKATVSYTLNANVDNLFLLGQKNLNGFGEIGDNQIHGNAGDNVLRGRGGTDKLFGGAGNDRLFGGPDGDFFQFATGWDHDVIADFEKGVDTIDVSKWKGVDDLTDVLKHAEDGKNGVVITLGHDSLIVEGVSWGDLVAGYFMF